MIFSLFNELWTDSRRAGETCLTPREMIWCLSVSLWGSGTGNWSQLFIHRQKQRLSKRLLAPPSFSLAAKQTLKNGWMRERVYTNNECVVCLSTCLSVYLCEFDIVYIYNKWNEHMSITQIFAHLNLYINLVELYVCVWFGIPYIMSICCHCRNTQIRLHLNSEQKETRTTKIQRQIKHHTEEWNWITAAESRHTHGQQKKHHHSHMWISCAAADQTWIQSPPWTHTTSLLLLLLYLGVSHLKRDTLR